VDWRKVVDKVAEVASLIVIAMTVAAQVDAWVAGFVGNDIVRLILIAVALYIFQQLVSAAVSLLIKSPRTGIRTALGLLPVDVGPSLLIYLLIWYAGPLWWIVTGLAGLAITEIVLRFIPSIGRRRGQADTALEQRVKRLAQGTGLNVSSVRVQEGWNAHAIGLGWSAAIRISQNLLDNLTSKELDVTLAHEIGHLALNHIRKTVVLVFALMSFMLAVVDFLLFVVLRYQRDTLPVSALPTLLFMIIVGQCCLMPLFYWYKRRGELEADLFAVKRTGFIKEFESAHRRITGFTGEDPDEDPPPIVRFLFFDHPRLAQRVRYVADHP
jgi:Zn-dependent protease with chaperone function